MGRINDPEVVEAINRILSACKAVGLPVGCFGVTAGAVRSDMERGCTLVTVGVDAMILGKAAEQMLADVHPRRAHARESAGKEKGTGVGERK